MARQEEPEEHSNAERWAVSYLDMITVMMCLFIVLFAISSVDQVKYEQLAQSLAAGIPGSGGGAQSLTDGGAGILDNTGTQPEGAEAPGAASILDAASESLEMQAARAEYGELHDLEQQMRAGLAGTQSEQDVTFKIDSRGLVIGLVSTDVFFEADSSRLTERAHDAIGAIAPVLAGVENAVAVEGHANTLPTTRFASNWELSSERATTVLRSVVDAGGVDPGRMRAVGMGDAHPVQDENVDPIIANRRVDIIVMSDAPEQVRDLIPEVQEQGAA